jgi:hypothetical protein
MAVVINDRLILGVLVVQALSRLVFQEETLIKKWLHGQAGRYRMQSLKEMGTKRLWFDGSDGVEGERKHAVSTLRRPESRSGVPVELQ